ncbi:MAG TPA: AAA family ATPase [Thermoanaerobaculia bacterium]
MIVLVNGAFGIGKTTVARLLARRMRGAVLFNPELIGSTLQLFRRVDGFQDLRAWRSLTVLALRVIRLVRPIVIVPMAFANIDYLDDIRRGAARFDHDVRHFCLVAPLDTVLARQLHRDAHARDLDWQIEHATQCCLAHARPEFAVHVDAASRTPEEIAEELLSAIGAA